MPVLVLFIGVGMLAGSEGVGGIHFENYEITNSLGSLALALILFDGGLRTSLESVRWAPLCMTANTDHPIIGTEEIIACQTKTAGEDPISVHCFNYLNRHVKTKVDRRK